MRYMKAADVLPPDLLAQVQAYIDGEYLYIPRRETSRKPWGAANGRKALGLNKMHKTVEMPDNGSVRGMIQCVRHLVKVEEI